MRTALIAVVLSVLFSAPVSTKPDLGGICVVEFNADFNKQNSVMSGAGAIGSSLASAMSACNANHILISAPRPVIASPIVFRSSVIWVFSLICLAILDEYVVQPNREVMPFSIPVPVVLTFKEYPKAFVELCPKYKSY